MKTISILLAVVCLTQARPGDKTVQQCTKEDTVLAGAQLTPGYYDGYANVGECVDLCSTLEGCRAVVFKPNKGRCFVKGDRYLDAAADTEGKGSISVEMCCLKSKCARRIRKTVDECIQENTVLEEAQLATGFYDGYASVQECVELCKSLEGCKATVFKPKVGRCFVKGDRYKDAITDPTDKGSISFEMCCLSNSCESRKRKTVEDCTLKNQVLRQAQLKPGYYDGYPTLEACAELCDSIDDCQATVFKPKVKRCFVKGEGYLAPAVDSDGKGSSSLEMCCLQGRMCA